MNVWTNTVENGVFAANFFREEHPVFGGLAGAGNENGLLPVPVFLAEVFERDRREGHAHEMPAIEGHEGHVGMAVDRYDARIFAAGPTAAGRMLGQVVMIFGAASGGGSAKAVKGLVDGII